MITESSIEIAAPAATVWETFTDVERWPDWTASVERLVALVDQRIELRQRDAHEAPALAADHLAVRNVLLQVLANLAAHDLPKARLVAVDVLNHVCGLRETRAASGERRAAKPRRRRERPDDGR